MSWDSKKIYVFSTVEIRDTKQKATGKIHSKRNSSYFYYPKIHDKSVPVCQQMYLNFISLKKSEIHYWLANFHVNNIPRKRISTNLSQELEADEYIENENLLNDQPITTINLPVKKRSNQQLLTLTSFFENSPTCPSHYCRKNSKKLFLQTDIQSSNQLYEIYKTRCLEKLEDFHLTK